MDQLLARGRLWEAEQESVFEEVVSAFCSSPFLAPACWAAEISGKNHIRPCSLINCLHYLIFWVIALRETDYHLFLGINPGVNSTEGGSGVYSGKYGEGAAPPPPGIFDTLSLAWLACVAGVKRGRGNLATQAMAWLHSVAVHRRRSPKKTGGLNGLARTLRRKTS